MSEDWTSVDSVETQAGDHKDKASGSPHGRIKALEEEVDALKECVRTLVKRVDEQERKLDRLLGCANRGGFFSWLRGLFSSAQTTNRSHEEAERIEPDAWRTCGEVSSEPTRSLTENEDWQVNASELLREQQEVQKNMEVHLGAEPVPRKLKVGDVIERSSNVALNFSEWFQRTPFFRPGDNTALAADYWWPCVVTKVEANGGVWLHYLGYDNGWDHRVEPKEFPNSLRPVHLADANKDDEAFSSGRRVEVRLLQLTNIKDGYESLAYCWVAGKVVSTENGVSQVTLATTSESGLQRVKVSIRALRTLSNDS